MFVMLVNSKQIFKIKNKNKKLNYDNNYFKKF